VTRPTPGFGLDEIHEGSPGWGGFLQWASPEAVPLRSGLRYVLAGTVFAAIASVMSSASVIRGGWPGPLRLGRKSSTNT